MEFPLLAWSAKLGDQSFDVLDETKLPEEVSFITVHDYNDAVDLIRSMKTRAFGQLLTVFYALLITARKATKESLVSDIETAADALKKSRPTFAFGKYTNLIVNWAKVAFTQESDQRLFVERNILGILSKIKEMRLNRARLAASLFNDGDRILTHCNTSGELLLAARVCREQEKEVSFYATETRPYFQGRLTAWELAQEKFPVMLIRDNQAGELLKSDTINHVITGADRVALNGDVINKVGTLQLAILAQKYAVPFYSFVQEPGKTKTGAHVTIEYRDESEVLTYNGVTKYTGCNAYYPAFDITPHILVSKIITFESILQPSDLPEGWNNNSKH